MVLDHKLLVRALPLWYGRAHEMLALVCCQASRTAEPGDSIIEDKPGSRLGIAVLSWRRLCPFSEVVYRRDDIPGSRMFCWWIDTFIVRLHG